jgi:ketosteroid isomerase-like protein
MRVLTLAVCALASPIFAHEGEEDEPRSAVVLDADSQAVIATLDAFAAAYQATDVDAIHRLTLPDGQFSHIEGTFADWSWESYAGHLAEEMPSFSETRYQLSNIRPETHGEMAFATFDWSLDVVILSDQFEGGRHPVSMQGIGTVVLIKAEGRWKLRHLHTVRAKAPDPESSVGDG